MPCGQSSQKFQMKRPMVRKSVAGTRKATRQAVDSGTPKAMNKAITPGMKICVTPPPRLPQPAEKALAVPTMRGAKSREVQAWHGTNVAPAAPMNARKRISEVAPLVNSPAQATKGQP